MPPTPTDQTPDKYSQQTEPRLLAEVREPPFRPRSLQSPLQQSVYRNNVSDHTFFVSHPWRGTHRRNIQHLLQRSTLMGHGPAGRPLQNLSPGPSSFWASQKPISCLCCLRCHGRSWKTSLNISDTLGCSPDW